MRRGDGLGPLRDESERKNAHRDCYVWEGENCGAEDCAAANGERRRRHALHDGAWGALELRREESGWRHYLDGEPVHCGTSLELQHLGTKSDEYGEILTNLPTGTRVRYEAALAGGRSREEVTVTLHVYVGGEYEFVADHSPRMRFRWLKNGGAR